MRAFPVCLRVWTDPLCSFHAAEPEMEMGQRVMGQCQWPIDPWSRNNCKTVCIFLFLVDIEKLLTHSISPIIIAGGLISIYDFFCSRDREGCPVPRPLLVQCAGWNDVMAMGHGSWVTEDDPFPSLSWTDPIYAGHRFTVVTIVTMYFVFVSVSKTSVAD